MEPEVSVPHSQVPANCPYHIRIILYNFLAIKWCDSCAAYCSFRNTAIVLEPRTWTLLYIPKPHANNSKP